MLVKLMDAVEGIPEVVLTEGLPWNWQSTDGYMAMIVSGVPVDRHGEATDALPGRLVRGTSN